MKNFKSGNVYSFVLDEQEWYSATEQQREAWVNQIMREGQAERCMYLSIMVKPDEVLSISPVKGQHRVWAHTFESSEEANFRDELADLRERYVARSKLTILRARTIATEVFAL